MEKNVSDGFRVWTTLLVSSAGEVPHVRSIQKIQNLRLAAANYKVRMRTGSLVDKNGSTSCAQVHVKCIERELTHRGEPIRQGKTIGGAELKKAVTKC